MIPEITRFFEHLAEAADDTFETLSQSIETFFTDLDAELSAISDDIEMFLHAESFEEDLDWSSRRHSTYWIYDDSTQHWHYRISPLDSSGFPAAHIGDANCRFNALSPQLRCAVNPQGPCESCKDFEPHPPTPPEA